MRADNALGKNIVRLRRARGITQQRTGKRASTMPPKIRRSAAGGGNFAKRRGSAPFAPYFFFGLHLAPSLSARRQYWEYLSFVFLWRKIYRFMSFRTACFLASYSP